jgi:hypothetical protein
LVAITEHGEVHNPISRFMGRFFFSKTATMDGFLANLATRLNEPGQAGSP